MSITPKAILPDSANEASDNIPIVSMPQINKQYINNCRIVPALCFDGHQFGTDRALYLNTISNISIGVRVVSANTDVVSVIQFTPFDLAVMDAVYTLYVHNCPAFTTDILARVIYGDHAMEVTDAKRKEINASITKLRNIGMYIDWTAEFLVRERFIADRQHRKFNPSKYPQNIFCCTAMLPVEDVTLRVAYHTEPVQGYRLVTVPAMYRYASYTHQIINVPAEMMRVPGVPNTRKAMLIRRHLIRHIGIISKNKRFSRKISYGWSDKRSHMRGLPFYIGECDANGTISREEKSRIHHTVLKILDWYKSVGYIADYYVDRRGYGAENNPITGVIITPRKGADTPSKPVDRQSESVDRGKENC